MNVILFDLYSIIIGCFIGGDSIIDYLSFSRANNIQTEYNGMNCHHPPCPMSWQRLIPTNKIGIPKVIITIATTPSIFPLNICNNSITIKNGPKMIVETTVIIIAITIITNPNIPSPPP